MISAEPALRVQAMAELARGTSGAGARPCATAASPPSSAAMGERRRFEPSIAAYLDRFGDRCLEELKLESPTLFDDPLSLLRSVGQLARQPVPATAAAGRHRRPSRRAQAEERVRSRAAVAAAAALLFGWVLRTLAAGSAIGRTCASSGPGSSAGCGSLILELGRKFHALDLLDQPRDVFYLEVERDPRLRRPARHDDRPARSRRRAQGGVRALPQPSRRRPTASRRTAPSTRATSSSRNGAAARRRTGDRAQGPGLLSRRGARPGARHHRPAQRDAEARATSSWPSAPIPAGSCCSRRAAGLLVERGSLLSHSAIVAREMGIPAVVSLAGVTRWLKDGDWVELDGSTGVVGSRIRSGPRRRRSDGQ